MSKNTNLNITEAQIKEIAEDLDRGFECYIHKETGAMIKVPDREQRYDMDTTAFEAEHEELEANRFSYFELQRMTSHDSFQVMENFAAEVENNTLKGRLFTVLGQRKPFSNFKFIVDRLGPYRQQWFDFKAEQIQQWVKDKIDSYNRRMDALNNRAD